MDTAQLLPSPVSVSRVGFGCASLMQLPSRRERERVLATAFDEGVRHFDVARMYGLGATEREVGAFLRARRGQVTVATKFGIDAPSFGPFARLQGPARAALRRFPQVRSLVKRGADEVYAARQYTPELARASLQTSLRELGTDHIDLFLLHEPSPRDEVDAEGLRRELDGQVAAGTIGAWGVSGEPEDALPVAERLGDVVLQLSDSLVAPSRAAALAPRPPVTFRVLKDALGAVTGAAAAPSVRARWERELDLDPTGAVLARLLVQEALDANPDGALLVASTRPERVSEAVRAADGTADPGQLAAFRRLVAELDARVPA